MAENYTCDPTGNIADLQMALVLMVELCPEGHSLINAICTHIHANIFNSQSPVFLILLLLCCRRLVIRGHGFHDKDWELVDSHPV